MDVEIIEGFSIVVKVALKISAVQENVDKILVHVITGLVVERIE